MTIFDKITYYAAKYPNRVVYYEATEEEMRSEELRSENPQPGGTCLDEPPSENLQPEEPSSDELPLENLQPEESSSDKLHSQNLYPGKSQSCEPQLNSLRHMNRTSPDLQFGGGGRKQALLGRTGGILQPSGRIS